MDPMGYYHRFVVISVYRRLVKPKFLTELTEEEFKQGYRKAQLIDVENPVNIMAAIYSAPETFRFPVKTAHYRNTEGQAVYLYCSPDLEASSARLFKRKPAMKTSPS
ncbi:hypothetical protein [Sinobaca sp. H24]|uniref:hypothetical protein n=1 Tax=Sinobaca sp. H24 TaxID=2923376 RepID=UPI0035B40BBE